jgi:hypothetical protein
VSDLACGTLPATLAAGHKITCTATHAITAADMTAGSFKNTSTGTANFGKTALTVTADATVTLVTTPAPKIEVKKTAREANFVAAGNVLHYSYEIKNTGNVIVAGPFTVTDDKTTVTCPDHPTTLAPGDTITCTATYTVTDGDNDAGHVTNTAQAHATYKGTKVDSTEVTLTVNAKVQPTQTVAAVTASPSAHRTSTPPPTSTPGNGPTDGSTPLFALLICLAFGGFALVAVEGQRRAIRR